MERRRFSSTEARAELIAAGQRQLLERGVEAGLGRVTLHDAVTESGVPRASAYRAFSTDDGDPQDVFRLAVVTELIESVEPDVSGVLDAITPLIMTQTDTPRARAAALREIIRVWSASNFAALRENRVVQVIDAIGAAAAVDPAPSEPVLQSIRMSQDRSHQAFLPLYGSLVELFGLRLRPGFTLEQVASMFRAVANMALQEWTLQPATRHTVRPTGEQGADQEWTLIGIVIEGLVLTSFTSDPDSTVVTDLGSWLDPPD